MTCLRHYLSWRVDLAPPKAKNLFFECTICDVVVPTAPDANVYCSCRNVMIDDDYHRIKMTDPERVKLFSLGSEGST
jgi:hypothetical protein